MRLHLLALTGWIVVFSLACGSNASERPVIKSLNPATLVAGTNTSFLTVIGNNFSSRSVVFWNGQSLSTSVISDGKLRAMVPAADLAAVGMASIVVRSRYRTSNSMSVSIVSGAGGPPTITTSSLPAGTLGSTYNATLNASGGTPPYSWAASGALPPGLAANPTGLISGTPTQGGTYSFTVQVTDSASATASATLGITIQSASGISITTNSLAAATVGTAYSSTPAASGGTPPYSWVVVGGALPAGLTLSSGGTISGTPSASGMSSFTIQVRDSSLSSATKSLSLTVKSNSNTIVWSADMETGNLSQWTIGGTKGGSYDSGNCTRPTNGVSTAQAHTGSYSMEMTINTSTESGCRQFRNQEVEAGGTYYYGVWYYLPQNYQAANYWNIFQFKSNNGSTEDPFWVIDLMPTSSGAMHLRLRWKGMVAGPYSGQSTALRIYDQSAVTVPVGQWFHIEAFLQQAGDFTGHLTIWQDGVQLWDMVDVVTKYSNGDQRWSTNNYSDGISPNPISMYVDDATISTQRVGP